MTNNKRGIVAALVNGIRKLGEKSVDTSNQPQIDPNYKIKYDGSFEEMFYLGLVDETATAIDRYAVNQYMSIVENRRSVRELPDFESLKKQGVVNEYGEVLDKKRFQEYKDALFDAQYNHSRGL